MSDDVACVIPDKLGGSLEIVRSLIAHRPPDAPPTHLVLTHNRLDADSRATDSESSLAAIRVEYELPRETLFAVLARLRHALPPGGGALVSNDWIELAMEHAHPSGRPVVQVLHGDHPYYYDLAVRHEAVIDGFVAYATAIHAGLLARLPHRRADIHYLPYGVTLPGARRRPHAGPLRLIYAGRLDQSQKGVFDLPDIDRELARREIAVTWTVIGGGPQAQALRARWDHARPVAWTGALSHAATLEALPCGDVFVLPTRSEGFPVALVEAMGAGLVPVVSDIVSGIPEVVDARCGFRLPVGDVRAFAEAIAVLAADRGRLEEMSAAARARVAARFDPSARARAYYDLFAAIRPRPRRPSAVPYGSRLDRPWIPNAVVRAVRGWRARP